MKRRMNHSEPAALGLRACKGGATVVCLALVDGASRVVASTLLKTSAEGDRLSVEPYKVAAEALSATPGKPSAEAMAAVEAGRRRQDQLATKNLRELLIQLSEAGYKPTAAGLLVNRAGWITDLLTYSLAWPEHVPVAELLAVRDALRFALAQCDIEVAELDEKSLPDLATKKLGMSPEQIAAVTKALGASVARPWRKEQKQACLAAWLATLGGNCASFKAPNSQ